MLANENRKSRNIYSRHDRFFFFLPKIDKRVDVSNNNFQSVGRKFELFMASAFLSFFLKSVDWACWS